MAQRRRYLGREELVDLIVRRIPGEGLGGRHGIVAVVLDELAALGVDISGLVRVEVDEADEATYEKFVPGKSLSQRIADAQPRIVLH
jgi:hypothetical protein